MVSEHHCTTYEDPNFAVIKNEGIWEAITRRKKHHQSNSLGVGMRTRELQLPLLSLNIQIINFWTLEP
jgi:hypothetical protein